MDNQNIIPFRQSIRAKLLSLLLGLTILSIVIIAYFSVSSVLRSGQRAQAVGNEVLQQQAEEFLVQLTLTNAQVKEASLAGIQLDADHIAQFTGSVFDAKSHYSSQTYWLADEKMFVGLDGQFVNGEEDVTTVFAPNTIEIDEALVAELELTSYLDRIIPGIAESDASIVAVYMIHKMDFTRYYPNINLGEIIPPDFSTIEDIFFTLGTPDNNPERNIVWTPIYDDPAGQGLLVTAVAPVYTSQNEFVGTIGIDVSLSELTTAIEGEQLIADGYSFLINQEGLTIGLPKQGYEDIFETVLDSEASTVGVDLSTLSSPFSPVIASMQNGETGFQAISANEKDLFVAYTSIPITGWSMASVVEAETMLQATTILQQEIESSSQSLVQTVILPVSIVILVVVGLAGYVFTTRMTNPIQQLVLVAQQFGQGKWDSIKTNELELSGLGEISVLANAFRIMASQLQGLIGSLEERVASRTQALETSGEVSRRLSTILDVNELAHEVVGQIRNAFHYYHAHIYLVDEAGENLVMVGGTGDAGQSMLAAGHKLNKGQGLVGRAADTKSVVLVSDVSKDEHWLPNPLLPETKAEVAIPIALGEQVLGVLDVQHNVLDVLDDASVDLLVSMANQVAIVLQNARLYEERRQAAAELVPFKLGFERSASAIFMTNLEGNIYYINPAFIELYGYTEAEVLGENPRILKSGLIPETQYNYIWETLLAHKPVVGEMINKSKDGRIVHVAINLTSILNDLGTPIGFLAMQTDITDRKAAESVLSRRVAELNGLSEIGRKSAEAPPVPEFLEWTAKRIPAALVQPDKCVAAVRIGDDVYGEPIAETLPRQMVEGLRVSGEQLGRLYIAYTDEQLFFTDDDSAFIGDVGRRISSYIESQTLLQTMAEQASDLAQQANELQIVAEIGTAVAAIRQPQQLLQTFVNLTKEKFDLYHVHLYQFEPNSGTLQLVVGAGDIGKQMVAEKQQISFHAEKSLVARTARKRQGVLVNDVRQEPDFLAHPQLPKTEAEMVVPLVVFDELLGVLDLQADKIDFFSETDLSIFTTLATQLGIALENAAQYAQTQETLVEMTAMQRAMTGEGWQAFLTAREKSVYGFESKDEQIKPIMKTVVSDDQDALSLQVIREEKTAVITPVRLGAAAIGSIGIRVADNNALTDEQQELLQAISEQVGRALERTRLSEQMQVALNDTEARTEELGLLNEMSQKLTAQINVDGVLDVAYDYTAQMITASEFYVAFYHDATDEVEFAMIVSNGKKRRYTERRRAANGLTEHIIHSGEPLLMSKDVEQHIASLGIASIGTPANSWVGVPLVFSGNVIGVMGVQSDTAQHTFSQQHLNLMTAIASQAAIAIENARLIEATTARAEEEQMLRQITARVNTAVDAEAILRTAAEEISRALGLEGSIVLESAGIDHTVKGVNGSNEN